jgi:hypothetical protein
MDVARIFAKTMEDAKAIAANFGTPSLMMMMMMMMMMSDTYHIL